MAKQTSYKLRTKLFWSTLLGGIIGVKYGYEASQRYVPFITYLSPNIVFLEKIGRNIYYSIREKIGYKIEY